MKKTLYGKSSEICLCLEYKTESVAKKSVLEVFYVIEHRNCNYLYVCVCVCVRECVCARALRINVQCFFARIYVYLNVELEV